MQEPAKQILIVEDDATLRKASELALHRAGYVVHATSSGREGLALARKERPNLIVLDLLMPRPTGLEILRTLKADAATRGIPVLVVSNSSMKRIVEEVESLGAEYIVKGSMSLHDLSNRVEKRLAKEAAASPPPTPASAPPTPAPPAPLPVAEPVAEPVAAPPALAEALAVPDEGAADTPLPEGADVRCAGCGLPVQALFSFCPKCGRKLAAPYSWGAMRRGVR